MSIVVAAAEVAVDVVFSVGDTCVDVVSVGAEVNGIVV